MRQTCPSSSTCMPFLNWFVETVSATARRLVPRRVRLPASGSRAPSQNSHSTEAKAEEASVRARWALGRRVIAGQARTQYRPSGTQLSVSRSTREAREDLQVALADDDEVLDADAALAGQVDARLDRDDVPGHEWIGSARAQHRLLVHLEPDAVAEPVQDGGRGPTPRSSCAQPRRARRRWRPRGLPRARSPGPRGRAHRPAAGRRRAGPVANVRVQSAQYPPTCAPASTITVSPGPIFLRPGWWCGSAAFRPAPTITGNASASAPSSRRTAPTTRRRPPRCGRRLLPASRS